MTLCVAALRQCRLLAQSGHRRLGSVAVQLKRAYALSLPATMDD